MSIQRGESFYETSLASAVTASQTSIGVVTAPNETSGYLVIEPKSTQCEIIKYSGVTGTTLTGVSRGLAKYGSDDSAGTGKAHNAGATIANTDVHYYFAQYYNFLTGTSASGYNTMKIGDSGTCSATNRVWQIPLSSYTPFWGLSANGRMVVSEDGLTSYVISAGGSGIAAGDGVAITGGVLSVDLLSSAGLRISGGNLAVKPDFDTLKLTSAAELYFDKTVANSWSGVQTFKNSCVFQSSGSYQVDGQLSVAGLKVSSYSVPMELFNGANADSYHVHSGLSSGTFTNETKQVSGISENVDLVISGLSYQPSMVQAFITGTPAGTGTFNYCKGMLIKTGSISTGFGYSEAAAATLYFNTFLTSLKCSENGGGLTGTVTILSINSDGFTVRIVWAGTHGGGGSITFSDLNWIAYK
jgi:hypothetical protein